MGVISRGIELPMIKEGDNLVDIIYNSLVKSTSNENYSLKTGDVIGITESIVARSQGNYVTTDDIATETDRLFNGCKELILFSPTYSRNRFAPILKGIARHCDMITIIYSEGADEVGNVIKDHPFTRMNYKEYYNQICGEENCTCRFLEFKGDSIATTYNCILDCRLHPKGGKGSALSYFDLESNANWNRIIKDLQDYFPNKCHFGLLGSNKASKDKIKLFPKSLESNELVYAVRDKIKEKFNVSVDVMIYGDGCFKDPYEEIWEFADPVTSPAYTNCNLNRVSNEIKVKYFIDEIYNELSGEELDDAIRNEINNKKDLFGNMSSEGTTPRRVIDLLASLMDLTSGSGDRCTPVVLVQNYFN